jgi:hypothetical protein
VAVREPEWLAGWAPSDWFDRYAIRFEDTRLPKGKAKQTELIELIGADGMMLLEAVHQPDAPASLRLIDRVRTLRQMWIQQYFVDDGQVRRRDLKDRPPGAERLVTLYDTDARGSVKRGIFWDGYKVHLTETCEPDSPNASPPGVSPGQGENRRMVRPARPWPADWPPQWLLWPAFRSGSRQPGDPETRRGNSLQPAVPR